MDQVETKPKTCVTCGHLRGRRDNPYNYKEWQCFKSETVINIVSGLKDYMLCTFLRQAPEDLQLCGPQGNWYEEYVPPVRSETTSSNSGLLSDIEEPAFDAEALKRNREAAREAIEARRRAKAAAQGLSSINPKEL